MDDCSIFVKVFDDRVDIESPGMPLGLDVHDAMSGRSRIRNQALALVFKAMGLIERYGSGVRRMVDACLSAGLPAPEFIEDRDYLEFCSHAHAYDRATMAYRRQSRI